MKREARRGEDPAHQGERPSYIFFRLRSIAWLIQAKGTEENLASDIGISKYPGGTGKAPQRPGQRPAQHDR